MLKPCQRKAPWLFGQSVRGRSTSQDLVVIFWPACWSLSYLLFLVDWCLQKVYDDLTNNWQTIHTWIPRVPSHYIPDQFFAISVMHCLFCCMIHVILFHSTDRWHPTIKDELKFERKIFGKYLFKRLLKIFVAADRGQPSRMSSLRGKYLVAPQVKVMEKKHLFWLPWCWFFMEHIFQHSLSNYQWFDTFTF